jgi:hypothetical protein
MLAARSSMQGSPGLIEAFRQTGTAAVIDREIQLKSRKRGLSAKGSLTVAGMIRAAPDPLAPPVNSYVVEDRR